MQTNWGDPRIVVENVVATIRPLQVEEVGNLDVGVVSVRSLRLEPSWRQG
jgi:hypothetical protein